MSVSLVDENADQTGPASTPSVQYFGPFTSADGRYVAYDSAATDLITGSGAGSFGRQIYLRDRLQDTNVRVTNDQFGLPISADSFVAGMSDDARYILFFSAADGIVASDTNGLMDLFVRDRQASTTILVSQDTAGAPAGVAEQGGLPQYPAYISADGNVVGFISPADGVADFADNKATRTVADDANGSNDIFVRNLAQGVTYLVTATTIGTGVALGVAANPGTIESFAMSDDGLFVAFATDSDNVVDDDAPGSTDVFHRNVLAGTTNLLTGDTDDIPLGLSYHVAISGDGSTVAFLSDEPTFAGAGPTPQVVVWNGVNTIASGGFGGGDPDGAAYGFPVLSDDGRYVFFRSDATNILPSATPAGLNVFRHDTQGDFTEVVSFGATGATTAIFGLDPSYAGGSNDTVGFASRISITPDGRFATWSDDSTGADPLVTSYPGGNHVYVRDMLSARPTLLDVSSASATTASDGNSVSPVINDTASIVAFVSFGGTTLTGGSPATHVYSAPVPPFNPGTGTGNQQPTYILNAPNVNNAGATSYTFQVTYRGPRPIVLTSLGTDDVTVLDPDGNPVPGGVVLVRVNSGTDANVLTATYRIIPPGTSWNFPDNGTYTVRLNANSITDQSGFEFPAQDVEIGSFTVNIPVAPSAGPTQNAVVSESVGTYTLTFTRTDLDTAPAFVTYTIKPLSAALGDDFSVTAPAVTLSGVVGGIPAGGSFTITFQIIDDSIVEAAESFEVVLSGASFGATFNYQRALVTILDNDGPGSGTVIVPGAVSTDPEPGDNGSTITLNNGVPTVSVPEPLPPATVRDVVIPLSRAGTGTTGQTVTFNYIVYAVPSDTAVPGVNFVSDSGTVIFAAGSDVPTAVSSDFVFGSADALRVRVLRDGFVTGDRTFTVVLTNATTGLLIGGNSIQVVVQDVDSAIQFDTPSITVPDDEGLVAIPITRVGNTSAASTVTLSAGGTAVEGTDFVFVEDATLGANRTLTFAPGETSKVIFIRTLSRPLVPGAFRLLTLSATGTSATQTIRINNVDATPPQVAAVDFKTRDGRVTAITVRFTEALIGKSARRLTNYTLFSRSADGSRLGGVIPLASAKYNPANNTVTLTPASRLPANALYQLNVNGRGTLMDRVGNRFDGSGDGKSGGTAVAVFGNGKAISYADSDNDLVSFRVNGPGTLKFVNLNDAVTINVLGAGAENSELLGNVARRRGGDGRAELFLLRLNGATFDPGDKFTGDIIATAALKKRR
jgi:hypothetical protein